MLLVGLWSKNHANKFGCLCEGEGYKDAYGQNNSQLCFCPRYLRDLPHRWVSTAKTVITSLQSFNGQAIDSVVLLPERFRVGLRLRRQLALYSPTEWTAL